MFLLYDRAIGRRESERACDRLDNHLQEQRT